MIYENTKQPILNKKDADCSIHNRFDIEVTDIKTGKVKQKAKAFNVILNQFWPIATGSTNFDYIWYGNGSGTPSASDTGLFGSAWRVSATSDATGSDAYNGIYWRRKKIVLSETQAVGIAISEVGVGTSGTLCTHAMLEDMNGNPITILKTNTDILTIYATVYAHWNPEGYSNGKIWCYMYEFGKRLSNLQISADYPNYYSGTGYVGSHSGGSVSYDSEERKHIIDGGRLPANDGNVIGGIRYAKTGYLVFSLRGEYPIIGEAVGTGDGITTDFSLAFDLPTNATIYVDGMEMTSGVTVYNGPYLQPHCYFDILDRASTPERHIKTYCIPEVPQDYNWLVLYNPYYMYGLKSVTATGPFLGEVSFSDDLLNWVKIAGEYQQGTYTIPEAYRYYRYIRIYSMSINNRVTLTAEWYDESIHRNGKMVHFDSPPPEGAVITADYTTAFPPKDNNHVFDFSYTISYGTYEGDT